jgi:hypothetical protein
MLDANPEVRPQIESQPRRLYYFHEDDSNLGLEGIAPGKIYNPRKRLAFLIKIAGVRPQAPTGNIRIALARRTIALTTAR